MAAPTGGEGYSAAALACAAGGSRRRHERFYYIENRCVLVHDSVTAPHPCCRNNNSPVPFPRSMVLIANGGHVLPADEMLGYIVSMYAQVIGNFVGVLVLVQSSRHPAYVQSRITAFLREKQADALKVLSA